MPNNKTLSHTIKKKTIHSTEEENDDVEQKKNCHFYSLSLFIIIDINEFYLLFQLQDSNHVHHHHAGTAACVYQRKANHLASKYTNNHKSTSPTNMCMAWALS